MHTDIVRAMDIDSVHPRNATARDAEDYVALLVIVCASVVLADTGKESSIDFLSVTFNYTTLKQQK